jgi:streptomycin 3"-adenylyltransferase
MHRLDPTAASQLDAVVRLLRDVLGKSVEAAYLHGSAVHGGLRSDSDLDILATTSRGTTDDERQSLIEGLLALSRSRGDPVGVRHLELTLVVRSDIRPWRYPPPMDFQYGDWWRAKFVAGDLAPWTSPNPDLAVVLTAVRSAGIPLFGPPAIDVLDPIPRTDLDRALRDVIPDLLVDLDDDTRNVLLTLARVWLTLETSSIAPKDVAASWALERLPEDRGDALRTARDAYIGTTRDAWDVAALASARADADAIVRAIEVARPSQG